MPRRSLAAALAAALLGAARGQVVAKHASELDLGCESYTDGVDWVAVKKQVKEFLLNPSKGHEFLGDLVRLGKTKSDCYIGLCSLGYLSFLFMKPERRLHAVTNTLFGSVPLSDQIPLSYWDTIHSGWPIFGLLELVAMDVRQDGLSGPAGAIDGCCDYLTSELDHRFRHLLQEHLSTGTLVPAIASLRYLAESPARCSWGKAAAYFALAERLLHVGSERAKQAAKDVMVLGEAQLEQCAEGRNVSVHEQMLSGWPFWSFLRRVEADALVSMPSQLLRVPPGYHAPPLRGAAALLGRGRRSLRQEDESGGDEAAAAREPGGGGLPSLPASCGSRDVHVAVAGDRRHAEGILAAVNSIVRGTASPGRVCLHVFCLQGEATFYRTIMRCSFGARLSEPTSDGAMDFLLDGVALTLHAFDPAGVLSTGMAVDAGVIHEAGDLNTPHNFIRFHLAEWVPSNVAKRLVYLDTDVIVLGDICELHDTAFQGNGTPGAIVAAVPRRRLPLYMYLKAFSPKMPVWLPSSAPSFNAGVMVIDMPAWERANVTALVAEWAGRNAGRELWRHGSQPPLLLLLHDHVEWLDEAWNVDGLGHHRDLPADTLRKAKILHWTGPLKPWLPGGGYRDIWEPFSVHCWRGHSSFLGSPAGEGVQDQAGHRQ